MSTRIKLKADRIYEQSISHSGHRLTPQRREVYEVLLNNRNHPTATEVFIEAQKQRSGVSLATVYNCLETLVECGLVKQVNMDREATRYCANLQEHIHFHCEKCGKVFDIPLRDGVRPEDICEIPDGFQVNAWETTLRGVCPECREKEKN